LITQSASPTAYGEQGAISSAFDGDLSYLAQAFAKTITGTALGTPSTGYVQKPENATVFTFVENQSGHNQTTYSNEGRTGGSVHETRFVHKGQGDFGAIHIAGTVMGAKPGATSFLASPAAVAINGGLVSTADGAYLNTLEFNHTDLGHSIAAIGGVFNFNRTNPAAPLSEVWMGLRMQSSGLAADVAYSAQGAWKRGLDLTAADIGPGGAAIVMKAGQRIYFEGVPSGEVAWSQNAGGASLFSDGNNIVFGHNNVARLIVNSWVTQVNSDAGLKIGGTGCLMLEGPNQSSIGNRTVAFAASNKPGNAAGLGPARWMKVVQNGYTFWAPLWAD
jgi:hypothetical protein